MSIALKNYLAEKHGLKAEASDADVNAEASRLVKSGELALEKYSELTKPSADPMDRLVGAMEKAVGKAISPLMEKMAHPVDKTEKGKHRSERNEFGGESMIIPDGSTIETKRASSWYSDSKSALHFPEHHWKSGEQILMQGRPMDAPSHRELAMAGAVMKGRIAKAAGMFDKMNDHDLDLIQEACRVLKWSGDASRIGGPPILYQGENLLDEHVKTIFATSTSGGDTYIPQVLEDQIVIARLLMGELTPYVDIQSIPKGTSVDTPSFTQLTIGWGTNEAAGAISPQSTTSLLSKANSPVFVCQGALEMGRDFISDTPLQVMQTVTKSYNDNVQAQLDYVIAIGDGTTQPLGLFTISGPTSVASTNGSAGSFAVADVENMIKALGKQYRTTKSPTIRWVSNDTTYWRTRAIPVGASDARRVFGQSYEDYMLAGRPYSVQNDIGNTKLGFGDLSQYRMWNRPGVEIQVEQSGRTLVLANTIMVVLRTRWAGRLLLTNAFVKMTTAPH